jgi:F-type H+-transporting ATPase subunit a
MSGYNFIENTVGHNNTPIVTGILVAAGVCIVAAAGKTKVAAISDAVVPDDKLTVRNFWDLIVSFLVSLGDSIMGKENRKYLSLVGSVFVFILFSNLLGLIPGMGSPTSSVTFNFGMSLIVFVCYNYWGVREMGFLKYFAHFGILELPSIRKFFIFIPAFALWCVLFCIEIVSHIVRPITLSVRLFANMTADHAILSVFTDLIGQYGAATIFYFMGTFICLIQAFVFTVLTMVYIRLACGHGEGEH